VSKVSIETACHFFELGLKDGVHYGTVVTSYGTVPEPQLARLFLLTSLVIAASKPNASFVFTAKLEN